MNKTLPLALALAASVLLNIALLRRDSSPSPAPSSAKKTASVQEHYSAEKGESSTAPPPPIEAADAASEVNCLRQELQRLCIELSASRADELSEPARKTQADPLNLKHPESVAFHQLHEALESLIETRQVDRIDEDGKPIKVGSSVLPRANRETALLLMTEYLSMTPSETDRFMDAAGKAMEGYSKLLSQQSEELTEFLRSKEFLEQAEQYEEVHRRSQDFDQRGHERQKTWIRESVEPILTQLKDQDGVRSLLLSRHLQEILGRLGSLDE